MVPLPFLIALVTLINVTRSFEYKIDFARCKIDLTCYVRDSCVEGSATKNPLNLVKLKETEKLNNGVCDVIVQMKAFTPSRFHIMMQVDVSLSENTSDELDTNIGLSLVHKDPQIKCSLNGVERKGVLTVDEFGNRQENKKSKIFCSVIVNNPPMIQMLFVSPPLDTVKPEVQFAIINTPSHRIIFNSPGIVFWGMELQCDDRPLTTMDGATEEYLLFEIDKAPSVLSCPAPQQIRISFQSKNPIFTASLECDLSQKLWVFKDEAGASVPITPSGTYFDVVCAIKFSELCSELSPSNCPGCEPPENIDHTVRCSENKWRLSDGRVVNSEVKCKQKGTERSSAWFMDHDGIEITEGGCSKEADCLKYSNLDFSIPNTGQQSEYQKIDRSDFENEIKCPIGYDITVVKDGNTRSGSALLCDHKSGLYKIGSEQEPIGQASNVFCSKTPEATSKDTDAISSAKVPEWLGPVLGGGFAVILLGGVVFFFGRRYIRHRIYMKEKYPDGMMTAREMNDEQDYVRVNGVKWTLHPLTSSMRQKLIKDKIKEPPKPTAYNVTDPVTEYNSEIMPREKEFDYWRVGSFTADILPVLHRYSTENRLKFFRSLTAFMHYTDTRPTRETEQFGMIDQFIMAIAKCHQNKLKCYQTWDSIFRLLKVFCDHLPKQGVHEIPLRLRNLIKTIASDILWDVGYKKKPGESEQTMGLRVVAARALLWAKDVKCMEELAKMAKLPLNQVESPLRMVVFSYAINNVPGKEKEIKEAFQQNIRNLSDREPPKGIKHGTYRQHLIYALCTAQDKSEESALIANFPTLRETFETLYENKKSVFTPTDLLYAYTGALENSPSTIVAVDQFNLFNPEQCEGDKAQAIVDDMFKKLGFIIRERAYDDEDKKVMAARHKVDMLATATLFAETCYQDETLKTLKPHWHFLVQYSVKPGSEVFSETFDDERLCERVHNLQFLLTMDMTSFEISKVLTSMGYIMTEYA